MPVSTVLLLASIGVLSLFCQWLAWRVRMPAILFLLAGGIASGPVLGYLNPEDVFGDLLFPMVSLAVAIILFEGSLTLRFAEIRGHGKMVRNLLPIGAIVTGTIGALSAHYILGISWEIALLFGAISIVTGPTVIAPLLRSVRPSSKLANILQWEGIIIDPIGALLAVLVFEGIVSWGQGNVFGHSLYIFAKTIAVGALIVAAAGYLNGQVLRKHWIPQYLHNAGTLTFMLGVYALSNELAHESGLLTVTIMGLWMANMKQVPVVLADTNWENVRQARMENLQVYFGNPVSEHASNQLDLTGVGNLLVISPYKHMNSLATYHFLDWFGDNSVYSLAEGDQDQKARHQTAEKIQQTRGLFNGVSYAKLASLASQGYSVKTTELSDEFSYQNFLDKYQSQALVLFMFDGKGRITPVKSMDILKPDEDSTLISLVPARAPKERKERKDRDNAEGNGAK